MKSERENLLNSHLFPLPASICIGIAIVAIVPLELGKS